MKKLFFLFAILMGGIFYANAQVIELVGHGVANENEPVTLIFTDPGSIEKVVVEAAAVFRDVENVTGTVKFNTTESNFIYTEQTKSHLSNPQGSQHWGYYTATFNNGNAVTLDKNGLGEHIVSFYAYVYRTSGDTEVYSVVENDHGFIFRNGSVDPVVYNFVIPPSDTNRDIELQLPFSDVASDPDNLRWAIVNLSAGAYSEISEFQINNEGDFLRLEKIALKNIPGNETNITLEIYSPIPDADEKRGDSFITGPVLLTTSVKQGDGCTRTIGYWKTHSEYGPAGPADPTWGLVGGPDAPFFKSDKTYFQVLWTPPAGNPYYILAVQYIAAELNILAGANGSAVYSEMMQAKDLFESYTPAAVKSLSNKHADKKLFKSLAGILDDYNNGLIGPGHCDDVEQEMETEETELKVATLDVSVHPNPIKNNGRIVFKPVVEGKATVDLFDAMGNKKATLFNQKVQPDMPVNLMLNARKYKSGNYVLVVTNGHAKTSLKVKIGR